MIITGGVLAVLGVGLACFSDSDMGESKSESFNPFTGPQPAPTGNPYYDTGIKGGKKSKRKKR